jgi:heme/copper-type cytochrome/quinol oxidase subunit 2
MGPSNVWWIVGAIFIIIGIVFIILHFQKEKVSGNTTIQKVFLYGGIILIVLGVILVSFWLIKKLTGKKSPKNSSLTIDVNKGYTGYSNGYMYGQNDYNQGVYNPDYRMMQGYPQGYSQGYPQGY